VKKLRAADRRLPSTRVIQAKNNHIIPGSQPADMVVGPK